MCRIYITSSLNCDYKMCTDRRIMFLILIATILFSNISLSQSAEAPLRQFKTEINPGCNNNTLDLGINCEYNETVGIVHTRSDGKDDSLHFVWSFIGPPSLLMVRTSLQSQLKINWSDSQQWKDMSISWEGPKPYYSFGWSLLTVWMFNDANDVVAIDKVNQSEVFGYNAKNFLWVHQEKTSVIASNEVNLSFKSTVYRENGTEYSLGPQGYFKIAIRMKNTEEYNDILPYMMYSGNLTQVDVTLNQVQLNFTDDHPYPDHPRLGLKYVFIQEAYHSNDRMKVEKVVTLDDEHSPGVFELFHLTTPKLNGDESFFEWKPVVYTAQKREIIDTVDVTVYDLKYENTTETIDVDVEDTILKAYYGDNIGNLLVETLNFTFGSNKDKFYNKTKLIAWSYSTGFGAPPIDTMSFVAMVVIAVGLGLPAFIIIASVVFVLAKRIKSEGEEQLLGANDADD